jgi:5-methylcytosine-specific restriction endonuclease McrA
MPRNYSEVEWQRKRNKILHRDNFTCQMCKTFNPSLGMVEILDEQNGFIELHEYESSPGHSIYRISSSETGQTIALDFGDNWLVLPILQIHHIKYIEDREIWEYQDNELITLCKTCHTNVHEHLEIPTFDKSGKLIDKRKYPPENFSSGRNHEYKPWIFIRLDSNREYQVTDVKPSIGFFVLEEENSEEVLNQANKMCKDFFERYLPDYKQ